MRRFSLVLLAVACCSFSVHAEETRLLKTGDVIEIEDGNTLSVPELRKILRSYGYTRLGTGGRYGSLLVMTAWGPDGNRYEFKINSNTGKVQRAWRKYSTRT
ncbi:hypothetical protein [Hyphococcus sp.]|jgi:hypothetical protein|uniref:hypothetical protein n=1 Tax=Hyphococcus sp. TaxID=2038636 RepID=UPI003D0DB6FA